MLPESWRLEPAEGGCCHSRRPRRGLVTSFPLWVECYTALVATLSTRYPEKIPHFMAYLRTITRASRNFEGTAWVSYDMAFRRQAANQRSLYWGVIDCIMSPSISQAVMPVGTGIAVTPTCAPSVDGALIQQQSVQAATISEGGLAWSSRVVN